MGQILRGDKEEAGKEDSGGKIGKTLRDKESQERLGPAGGGQMSLIHQSRTVKTGGWGA